MLRYNGRHKQRARKLRITMTDPERLLWSKIKGKQILNIQFYRQKPIGNYIVDFYAPKANLVIEVDGSQHREETHKHKDAKRDAYLTMQGLKVLRFSNRQVMQETDAVLQRIYDIISQSSVEENPPQSPFTKGEARES